MDLATSVYFYWAGVIATGLAALTYLGAFTYGLSAPSRAVALPVASGGSVVVLRERVARVAPFGPAAVPVWLAAVALGGAMLIRTVETGHAPFSNLFEYSMAFAFGLSLIWAIAEHRTRAKIVGLIVMSAAFGLAAGALIWPSEPQETLVPALQAGWILPVHVGTMLVAYSLVGLAAAAATLYLIQAPERRFRSLPPAAVVDRLAYRAVLFGFVLLGTGVALGAYWANDAWGRYWGWDPKETASLVTWLTLAIYMHVRGLRRWRGRRSAVLILAGFGMVIFTYLGVNLWISGLHSYAGV